VAAAILNRVGLGSEMGVREREASERVWPVGLTTDPSQVLVGFNPVDPGAKGSIHFSKEFNSKKMVYSI